MEANLPNILTVSRVLVAPVVCLLLYLDTYASAWLALILYVYACVTDFLDGFLARSWDQQSSFGRFLDPIADKLLVGLALLMLVGADRMSGINVLPAAVILWREILVSGLREYLAELNVPLPVTKLSKWKTTLQMIAIGFLLLGPHGPVLGFVDCTEIGLIGIWGAAILTFITGYDYLRAGLGHIGAADLGKSSRGLDRADPARDAG
ncbi:MAG: CDP-diacylglycerol--glycerol-3-phosphate 3-phosphatidyltransferase [Rhodospirillales bacterium]|nr:CDP-diacylglycerol--glycerol-3-phosphate 3-phosphatidyltransferase [Rhodospirillales bacterium]